MVLCEMVEVESIGSCDLLDGRCEKEGGITNDYIVAFDCNTY